jgi:hypothetical protein
MEPESPLSSEFHAKTEMHRDNAYFSISKLTPFSARLFQYRPVDAKYSTWRATHPFEDPVSIPSSDTWTDSYRCSFRKPQPAASKRRSDDGSAEAPTRESASNVASFHRAQAGLEPRFLLERPGEHASSGFLTHWRRGWCHTHFCFLAADFESSRGWFWTASLARGWLELNGVGLAAQNSRNNTQCP